MARQRRFVTGPLMALALGLSACAAPNIGYAAVAPHCSDLMASALTSPSAEVRGTFACMTADEQNFWHRWAISRDDQLVTVVHNHGLTGSGLVEGFEPRVLWTWAAYKADVEPGRHLYLVGATDDKTLRGLMVIQTNGRGLVDGFEVQLL